MSSSSALTVSCADGVDPPLTHTAAVPLSGYRKALDFSCHKSELGAATGPRSFTPVTRDTDDPTAQPGCNIVQIGCRRCESLPVSGRRTTPTRSLPRGLEMGVRSCGTFQTTREPPGRKGRQTNDLWIFSFGLQPGGQGFEPPSGPLRNTGLPSRINPQNFSIGIAALRAPLSRIPQ